MIQYTHWVRISGAIYVSVFTVGHADSIELGVTIAFDLEIIWRFCAHLPNWRAFGHEPADWIDLVIAIACSIIQIPGIHSSQVYAWFTAFQLARWYRVILEVPRMRPLILTVFGNSSGLINMTIFLLITNGLAALAAVQLVRGDMDNSLNTNFSQIWIAFLAMYQVSVLIRKHAHFEQLVIMRFYLRKIGRT